MAQSADSCFTVGSMRLLASVAALLVANACMSGQPGLHVSIEGPAVPGSDFDLLEVRAARDHGEVLHVETYGTDRLPAALPFSINFLSSGKLSQGTWIHIQVQASLAGAVRWRGEGMGSLRSGSGESLTVTLNRSTTTECSTSSECPSGRCVDGVCCATACVGSCERCDQPGKLGQCLPVAAQTVVSACGVYVCDGSSGVCPSRCVAHSDCTQHSRCLDGVCRPTKDVDVPCIATVECAENLTCLEGRCGLPRALGEACTTSLDCQQPKLGCRAELCVARTQSFSDDFNDNALAAEWTERLTSGGSRYAEQGGALRLTSNAGRVSGVVLGTASTLDGRESFAKAEVVASPDPALQSVALNFGMHRDVLDFVSFTLFQGSLHASKQLRPATTADSLASAPFNPQTMRFWKLSEAGGMVHWSYSADGKEWQELTRQPAPFDLSSVGVYSSLITGNETSSTTAIIDNVNRP